MKKVFMELIGLFQMLGYLPLFLSMEGFSFYLLYFFSFLQVNTWANVSNTKQKMEEGAGGCGGS